MGPRRFNEKRARLGPFLMTAAGAPHTGRGGQPGCQFSGLARKSGAWVDAGTTAVVSISTVVEPSVVTSAGVCRYSTRPRYRLPAGTFQVIPTDAVPPVTTEVGPKALIVAGVVDAGTTHRLTVKLAEPPEGA